MSAIDVVSGISFGHTCTQFCALPQSSMPPGSMQRLEPLVRVHRARRVQVEEARLVDRRRADEVATAARSSGTPPCSSRTPCSATARSASSASSGE